jgi:hypothetical protein
LGGSTWKTRAKAAIKGILTVVVLAFVGRHVVRTWRELEARGQLPHLEASWLVAGAGLYLLGLAMQGVYFWRVLQAGPTPIRLFPALRAYLISHLGKYVPGKALVVVMRAGMVVPFGARAAAAAFATLYETLVMMAAGGLVATVGFSLASTSNASLPIPWSGGSVVEGSLALPSLALGLAFLIIVLPAIFPRLAALARVPLPGVGPDALPRLSSRLLGEGIVLASLGWILLGLSQVAVIRALSPSGFPPGHWPLVVASVALATAAGFAVPVAPGGLGVREWILWTALGGALDGDLAVVAALMLRLTWIVAEIAAAAPLFAIRPPRPSVP